MIADSCYRAMTISTRELIRARSDGVFRIAGGVGPGRGADRLFAEFAQSTIKERPFDFVLALLQRFSVGRPGLVTST